jgi:hypothetical protein
MNKKSTQILSFKPEDRAKQEGKDGERQEKTNKQIIGCFIIRWSKIDPREEQ